MPFLIDGYNLLYATGRLTPRAAKPALEASRKWLLVELVRYHGPEASGVTVVFDALNAPPGVRPEREHGGVKVVYSRGQAADDLIEEMIEDDPSPRLLTVISDDNRIKQAARRRGCEALGCLDYCERWQQGRAVPDVVIEAEPVKPEESEEEKKRWLDVFGEADDSPYG